MKTLIKNIEQWAEDRNLINGSTPQKQFIKLIEEFGELCSGVAKNKSDVIKDSIGDCIVVTIILMKQLRIDNSKIINITEFFTDDTERLCLYALRELGCASSVICYAIKNDFSKTLTSFFKHFIYYINNIALNHNLNLKDCLETAYDEIKDRKGKMVDGVFVKEEDLK